MKFNSKKFISIILSVILVFSACITSHAEETPALQIADDCCPTIIVPGLMQSKTRMYNDDGTVNEAYEAPFFMDDTSTIVADAVSKVLMPLLSVLTTQSDPNGVFAQALADTVTSVLASKIKCDENGDNIYNIEADRYLYSYADCTPEEQKHIIDNVPVTNLINTIGGENLYFFSFNSFGNIDKITAELYEYIQMAKEQTGSKKVNIVPISQGGGLCNNLLEYYPQVMDDLNRIIYVVPCLDGTDIMNSIFLNGFNDENEALYGYMMPYLLGEQTGKLVNIVLRILPTEVLKNALQVTVDTLVNDGLQNSTLFWAFAKAEDYEVIAEKYLSDEGDEEIRRQADRYQKARVNSYANILKAKEKGVEVFNLVNYNHALYPIVGCWDEVNADGIIDLDSTSMGSTSAPCDCQLPAGYTQQGNSYGTCSDPTNHNHIDSHNIVDASTGLLPDHTFYFYNGNHEQTGINDVLIGLVERLLVDETFTDVYSYPEQYPQFNTARVTRGLKNDLKEAKKLLDTLDADKKAELEKAIAEVEALLKETVVDGVKTQTVSDNFYTAYNNARGIEPETESFTDKVLDKVVTIAHDAILNKYGYNSFSGK